MCRQINVRYSCGHVYPEVLDGCNAAFDEKCPDLVIEEYPEPVRGRLSVRGGLFKMPDGSLLCGACLRKSMTEIFKERATANDARLERTEADRKMQLTRSRAASHKRRGKAGGEIERKPKGKGPEKVREEHRLQNRMKYHWA